MTIHGDVCLCINLSGEDIFEKNIFGNKISYLECLP